MDIFLGVLINAVLVVVGSGVGLLFKGDTLKRVGERVFQVYAFFVLAMGINGAADISDPVLILVSLIIGVAIGEIIDIDKQFTRFGNWAQSKFAAKSEDNTFAEGFIQASLLFCIGSMTFMGAMESALQHQHTIYITKGVLDCISGMTIAMSMGIGTMLSAVSVIIYQGILVALASLLSSVPAAAISMCCTIGSLFLIGIGTNMLGITKIKVANFLPAMFIPIFAQLLPFVNL